MPTLVRGIPDTYLLRCGNHNKNGNGQPPDKACFMEFESWLAGKEWTDHMPCACHADVLLEIANA